MANSPKRTNSPKRAKPTSCDALEDLLESVISGVSQIYENTSKKHQLIREVITFQKEELAELIVALSHWERGKGSDLQVAEEIIDTFINSLIIILFLKISTKDMVNLEESKITKTILRLEKKGILKKCLTPK